MTFVFPLLLGGLALTGIPVLLHLIQRQKPKRLPFPAFRFLAEQRRSNQRKLRLRHLLLLLLRMSLIAAMCLFLARPRLFHRALGLDSERPVQAVLVFDTSASMEYRSSDGVSRLDAAKEHARKLLNELAPGSQVAVVDSAEVKLDAPLEWQSLLEARKRIGNLKVRYANAPVTHALLKALTQLDGEPDKKANAGPPRLRLIAVLSDRTRGGWDGGQTAALVEKLDRLTPLYEGLMDARGQIGPLADQLRELRTQLPPPAGKDYNEQALLDALTAMQNELTALWPDRERWPPELLPAVRQVRRLSRELLSQLPPAEPSPNEPAYGGKLRAALAAVLRATSGAQMLFIDVGIEAPVDLVLTGVELPRTAQGIEQQLFADGEPFTLHTTVQATGKDAVATVVCEIGDARQETQVALKASERQTVPFRVGEGKLILKPGDNSIAVHLDAKPEALPHAHHRFVTVRVRPRQKVLVLVDDPERKGPFARALSDLGYAPEVRPVKGLSKDAFAGAAAVYLLGVAAPEAGLWTLLGDYVKAGGGLGVVPAGNDMNLEAYGKTAQTLLPGKLTEKIDKTPPGGSEWDWTTGKYTHSFMKRFKAWKDNPRTDFIRLPRGAYAYWAVTPHDALVLVAYQDKDKAKPAVLERRFDASSGMHGKTLLFTTPLDEQDPRWNNYAENVTSFYLALLWQATSYLAGETAAPALNFTLGHGDPLVTLPAGPALSALANLTGPEQRPLTLEPGQAQLVLKDLTLPGNYAVAGKTKDSGELRRLAGFSLNVPAEECDLAKVPEGELEPVFGDRALVTVQAETFADVLQSYRDEPLDLMPYVMLAVLLALALENLLANKFYRAPLAG